MDAAASLSANRSLRTACGGWLGPAASGTAPGDVRCHIPFMVMGRELAPVMIGGRCGDPSPVVTSAVSWANPDEGECTVARGVIEMLTDDLDGGDAVETVSFGLDGTTYEIDLSKRNATAMRRVFERYVTAARPSPGSKSPTTRRRGAAATARRSAPKRGAAKPTAVKRSAASTRDYDLVALREWAGANDVVVPSRGRIPRAVVDQYKARGGR
jgi:nucleoid-associated protein Lsr2